VKFPDLLEPIQQVNREIRLLETFYLEGDATYYRQTRKEQHPDWDLSVISAPEGSLLFALDLDYKPNPETRVFHFNQPRPSNFAFEIPAYNRQPADVFRVDAQGIYDVNHEPTESGIRITDTRNLVGIYVATKNVDLRGQLQKKLDQLKAEEIDLHFNPARNSEDLTSLESLLQP
jgi:hypothetical protein